MIGIELLQGAARRESGRGVNARSAARRLLAVLRGLIFVPGLVLAAGTAMAQNVDLVLNHDLTSAATINASDTAAFTVTVDNSDPTHTGDANNVVVTYQISATDTLLSASPSQGSCSLPPDASNTFTCNFGTIPHTTNATLDVVVRATGTGVGSFPYTMTTNAAVATSSTDTEATNNDEERTVTVQEGTDVGIVLNSSPGAIASGGIWTHEMVVTNHGPIGATNIVAHLDLPAGAILVGSLPAGCSAGAPGVVCQIASLALSGVQNIGPITTQIAATSGSNLSATALVDSLDQYDGNTTNQSSTRQVDVNPGSDLAVTLGQSGGPFLENEPFALTANPSYTGEVPDVPELSISVDPGLQIQNPAVFNQNGWTCSVSGQLVSCSGLDTSGMTAGANQPLGVVTVNVVGDTAGTYSANEATVSADYTNKPDPNLDNNIDGTAPAIVAAELNLGIVKSAPQRDLRTIGAAYPFDYSVTVRNNGNVGFWGDLTWTDTVPEGLTITNIAAPGGWTCTTVPPNVVGADTFTCSRTYAEGAPFAVNATQAFTITAFANGDIVGDLVNGACLTTIDHDLGFLENEVATPCSNATINAQTPGSSADLLVEKTASAATVNAGETLTYTLRIVNDGPATSTSVTLTDVLSNLFTNSGGNSFQGVTVNNGTASGGSCGSSGNVGNPSSRTLSCTFTSIPVCSGGDCPTVTVTILPHGNSADGTALTRGNTASAYSSVVADPDYSNNTDNVDVSIDALTDLALSKTVTTWSGELGTPLNYRIQVTNEGASGASSLTMTDVLPHDLTYLSVNPGGGASCATQPTANSTTEASNDQIICTRSTLARGATWTIDVATRPNHGIAPGSTLVNNAVVTTDTPETTSDNNADTADAEVGEASVDLAVIKSDTPDPVFVADTVTYTVQIINNGPSVASAATIYDFLPSEGFRFVEDSITYYDVSGGVFTEIDPGDLAGLGIACSKEPDDEAFGTGYPDQPLDDSYLWPMDTVENPDYLDGVWDPLQGDLVEDADLICNMGLLLNGQIRAIRYELEADTRGVYFNYAISRAQEHRDNGADGPDPVPTNDVTRERTTVRSVPDVSITKVASSSLVSVMEPFDFVITFTNHHATEPAYFPEIRDVLPAGMELTGAPILVSGAPGGSVCTGAAGDESFECSFGSGLPPGQSVTVSVPVWVVSDGAGPRTNRVELHLDTDLEFDEPPPPVAEDEDTVDVVISSLAGRVYHDNDYSGVHTVGNPPIENVLITLNGVSTWGDPVTRSATTAPDGTYFFGDLPSGLYTVTQTQPGGWIDGPVNPGSVGGVPVTNEIGSIELPADTDAVQYNFGEYLDSDSGQLASVAGHVYHDANRNGVFDDAESGIADVVVTLWRDGAVVATALTDAGGAYFFGQLAPGTYRITETHPDGWIDGAEAVGVGATEPGVSPETDVFESIVLQGGDAAQNYDFGEYTSQDIAPIPTLQFKAMLLLILLMGVYAMYRRREV
ncbi:SdrD B-like domain-containing protein [Pseudazoarcus pumilus]|uniref:SD-repeat containing protein B domain-containing protein n=1 Tax=Pseudazoarcus pumilus TaxID=2067960 RepID=A0A2I6S387_9RHOO|nr:SdrD B-like domain-containing protein [Pseudazoarcus pumilus]AUN93732.1 hypothetical protein C0099_01540 [Pseudazoarcus pumilus]